MIFFFMWNVKRQYGEFQYSMMDLYIATIVIVIQL